MIDTHIYCSRGDKGRAVTIGSLTIFFSYDTIIAFRDNEGTKCMENYWSNTTARHMCDIGVPHKERLNSKDFETELNKAYIRAGILNPDDLSDEDAKKYLDDEIKKHFEG